MELTAEQEAMARGGRGPALEWAVSSQVRVGRALGAGRLVPVTAAHLMGDMEVLGEAGLKFLEWLAAHGARVRVPTTTNARCVDFAKAGILGQDPTLVADEGQVKDSLRQMGVLLADTCINYQTLYQPTLDEHLAWGDTGTVVYANSVYGARTNFESGPAALAAALTGYTPAYGFHLDEQRRGTVLVEVDAELTDLADWGALGGAIGNRVNDYWSVPVVVGALRPGPDALKHFGAALASYGSLAMYHMVGITPEAPDVATALGGREPARRIRLTSRDIRDVYQSFSTDRQQADVVAMTGPQLSIFELERVAESLSGRRVHPATSFLLTTNAQNRALAYETGCLQSIEEAGAHVLTGTCFYLMTVPDMKHRFGWQTLVTNSAKAANIVGGYRLDPVLCTTDACVEAAVSGKVPIV